MDLTTTAWGAWSGGRFTSCGEPLPEARWLGLVRQAYECGIRTFVTADIFGAGAADSLLGQALKGLPRDSYSLVGAVGHDIYHGTQLGSQPYPRFTDPDLRRPADYASYLRMATERSLERCGVSRFDLLLLQHPDQTGYTNDRVWIGLQRLVEAGLVDRLGIAPGPANGFTLDLLQCFERFGSIIDWAMIPLSPLEPWPGRLILTAAEAHDINVMTRGVDYGGLFHDDLRSGHTFGSGDPRSRRSPTWLEDGLSKLGALRPLAGRKGRSLLQLACAWNLQQTRVRSVVPSFMEESGDEAKSIERQVEDFAGVSPIAFTAAELAEIEQIGDNQGRLDLRGAHRSHLGEPEADRWALNSDLRAVAERWRIDPDFGLAS